MILLDTDHITVLAFPEHSQFESLKERVSTSNGQSVAITAINIEEPLRGWLAEINRHRNVLDQIVPYDRPCQADQILRLLPDSGLRRQSGGRI